VGKEKQRSPSDTPEREINMYDMQRDFAARESPEEMKMASSPDQLTRYLDLLSVSPVRQRLTYESINQS